MYDFTFNVLFVQEDVKLSLGQGRDNIAVQEPTSYPPWPKSFCITLPNEPP